MGKYDGKTLLMLGSNIGAPEMVRYARKHGAYTIVADYYEAGRSAAKRVADEQLFISTADLKSLSKVIAKRHVDGVLAGISEFNLQKAMELSRMHGLPFYCEQAQWHMIERKDLFRSLCERYAVPCPQTYFVGDSAEAIPWDRISYPAVLKPTDANSSRGVHICNSKQDIVANLEDAFSCASAHRIIIEQFATGTEFTAHYVICGGKAALACIDNRYPVAVHEGNVTTIPVARLYPCLFLDEYLQMVNPQLVELCEGLGVKDGVLFVQGLYNKATDSFAVFEAGLRSAAEAPCRFIQRVTGNDYFQLLVDHALLGESDYDLSAEDPSLGGLCCGIVSIVAKGGIVGTIDGLEESVAALPSVVSYESRYPVGTQTPDGDTLRQLMIRFVMVCKDRREMSRHIAYLNENISVLDSEGQQMTIRMDPSRVFGIE